MIKSRAITCDMTIMLPSSARRMSLGRSRQANKKKCDSIQRR
jgi:hypothetical protein